ncbi:MAG: hypothetical protein MI861_21550, partial [Pirellulales bacterium]|nr:hypothetical protein [Pirellulales bacterium]
MMLSVRFVTFGCLFLAGTCLPCPPASAQTSRSVRSVPSDASFFFGLHHGAEFLQRLADSEFGRQVGFVPEQWFQLDVAGDESAQPDPLTEDITQLMTQLLASDAFVYGGADWCQTFEAVARITEQRDQLRQAQGDDFDAQQFFLSLPDEDIAEVRIPSIVLAFELADVGPAQRLIAQYEPLLNAGVLPTWVTYHGPRQVGDDSMHVLGLTAELGKWIRANWDPSSDQDLQVFQKLQRIAFGRELMVAIGIVDSRLAICVGEDLQAVEAMSATEQGDSNPSLMAQASFASILNQGQSTLLATGYVSDRWVEACGRQGSNTNLVSSLGKLLVSIASQMQVSGVDAVDQDQTAILLSMVQPALVELQQNLDRVSTRWQELSPPKGGWSAAVWMDRQGLQGRSVVRTVDPRLPARPLDAHRFAGSDPVLALAWQGGDWIERASLVTELVQVLGDSLLSTSMAMLSSDPEMAAQFQMVQAVHAKLDGSFDELRKIAQEQWAPSLDDGG